MTCLITRSAEIIPFHLVEQGGIHFQDLGIRVTLMILSYLDVLKKEKPYILKVSKLNSAVFSLCIATLSSINWG